ncbi:MAG: hypothetical protein ACKKMP_03360 [Candidatus Nealsonbacteria bacterium]
MDFKSFIILIIIIAGAIGVWIGLTISNQLNQPVESKATFDPLNTAYIIEGESFELTEGKSEKEIAPGSATKIKTSVLGKAAIGDLNSDGADDAALVLVHDPEGSGTFFYVAAALQNRENGQAVGTNAVLLGDRIIPQNISIYKGAVEINYADRKQDEPMSTRPSVAMTKYLIIDGTTLIEISTP